MKKISATLLALLLVACFAGNVLAAPSVVVEDPVIVTKTDENGVAYIGQLVDEQGEVTLIPADSGAVVLTPIDAADTAADPEIKEKLDDAYNEIAAAPDLTALDPDLGEPLKEAITVSGSDVPVDNLVVRELFDVTVSGVAADALAAGKSVVVTMDLGVAPDALVIIMTRCETKWEVVPQENIKNNGDGTVDVKFEKLCPVAFVTGTATVTPPVVDDPTPPADEKKGSAWPWVAGAAVAALGGGGAFFAAKNKKKKEQA
ncbi:MAG: hypothetical protein GX061_07330 [Eubacteriaceae bacterium]|nr:hypothetical protein [Eubacteriaceae bacterium]